MLAILNWFDSPVYSDDSLGCSLGGAFWSLYTKIFISGFKVYKALRFCFAVFLPCGGFGIVSKDVASDAKTHVRFKDGTSKVYPAATKEQLDFFHATFQGNDRQIDEFGDKIVARPSGGFIAPVLDISPEFFSDLDSNGHKYEIVGHGKPLNDDCDAYVMTNGCLQVENHKKHAGLGFMHKIHHHCYNWRCPKDFFYGNAVRASGRITQRLNEKGLAIEAGAVSLPKSCYGLSESKMRAKSIGALFARDFLGWLPCFPPLTLQIC